MHHVGLNKAHFFLQKIFPRVDPFGHFRQLHAGAQLVVTYDPKRKYLGQIDNVMRPIYFFSLINPQKMPPKRTTKITIPITVANALIIKFLTYFFNVFFFVLTKNKGKKRNNN